MMAECLFSSHQVLAIRQLETGLICESTHLPVVRSLLVQFKERHWGALGQRLERGGEQTHLTEPHSLTQCQPEAQDSLEPSSFFPFFIFLNVYMVCVGGGQRLTLVPSSVTLHNIHRGKFSYLSPELMIQLV